MRLYRLAATFLITALAADLSKGDNVCFVGHSLVNDDMPFILKHLAQDADIHHASKGHITNGANLKWNWNEAHRLESKGDTINARDPKHGLPTGQFDVLVLTPATKIQDHLRWSQTEVYAQHFAALSKDANPKTRVFLYHTWPSIKPGNWKQPSWDKERDVDLNGDPALEEMAQHGLKGVQKHLIAQGHPTAIIPAADAIALLQTRIESGQVPGLRRLSEVFTDDIHMNKAGNYFIACVMLATIYDRSPVGLTPTIPDRWGGQNPFVSLPPAQARALQQTAWDTVQAAR